MIYRPLFLVLVLSILVGCTSKQNEGPLPDTATSGTLQFVADEALQPVVDSLVAGFNAEHPDAKVSVTYLPATQALDAMLQRRSRLVITGRPLNALERQMIESQQVELFDFDMALNAIALVTANTPEKSALSYEELRDNITGKRSTYTQVLGSHLSSTESMLDSLFHQDTATIKGKVFRYSTVDSIIQHLKNDPAAIAYLSSAWLKRIRPDSSLLVMDLMLPDSTMQMGLRRVMLHLAYVYQGKYPLVSRIMGYSMEPANTLPRGFLAYAMSPAGQRVFMNYDLLPRTQIIRLVPPRE